MRIISTYELRSQLSQYLDEVLLQGTSFIISRNRKPIAVVTPYKKSTAPDFSQYYGFLGKGESGMAFEQRIRRSTKEKKRIEHLRQRP